MMVSTVASALIFVERRGLIQVFPDSFIKFLKEWEVRVFIIVSLILQILLITLGNRRKYICKIWIRITLWSAYLLADWVAIVSLGIISKNTLAECQVKSTEDPLNQLMWFWAQFFLLHLGGPDTITAYSLEDNELWLRHLVGMVIQTGLASYVLIFALPSSSWLPVLGILIFIAGVIKYGERLSTLCAANSENFRDSMLTEPDPGPNYAKFMEEFTLKKAEGFYVEAAEVIEIPVPAQDGFITDPGKLIPEAYDMFLKFKRLFADAILSFQDRDSSQSYFRELSADQAFAVVEVELGFMFDELYTKASIVYNVRGIVLRMITFSSTLLALMGFLFLCNKSKYKKLDLTLTYLLLVVAICLEIYAIWVLINSDWTHNWLSRQDRKTYSSRIIGWFQQLRTYSSRIIGWFQQLRTYSSRIIGWFQQRSKKRRSEKMPQRDSPEPSKNRWSEQLARHNLLDLCVGDNAVVCLRSRKFLHSIRKLIRIENYLEKHWYKSFVDVSPELKNLIFEELKSYIEINESEPRASRNRKGSFTPGNYDSLSLDWMKEREFDQRILLWHIATDICYSLEWRDTQENIDQDCKDHSKHLSDYMLYLLIVCPFMLPIGIGMIRFRDTCAEAREFFRERNVKSSKLIACKKLLKVNTEVLPAKVKGDRSKSVLFDACKLAKSLREQKERKWGMISKEWVRMLAHAATHCSGQHHARQLRKGGELLTHVWLLMAHLGITEQFQISQGHARAKLIAK